MITPFRFDELFKINQESTISVENECLIIDDFFLNYDKIHNYIINNNVEIWKHTPTSRDFIDYYDCRYAIQNFSFEFTELDSKIVSVIKFYFNQEVVPTEHFVEFNYFKHLKKDISNTYQHNPHTDPDFNLIVYLDKECSGGTAIYDPDFPIKNTEAENLLYDVSGIKKFVVQAKPNRCVIFSGKRFHGGHIDNHDVYYDNWRINLVRFYERVLPRQES